MLLHSAASELMLVWGTESGVGFWGEGQPVPLPTS